MLLDMLAIAEKKFDPAVVGLLRRYHMQSLYLQVPPRPGREELAGCWFGGRPTLPADMAWPVFERCGQAMPMHFLAQFDCASLPQLAEYPMPKRGTLMFFYEPHLNMDRFCNPEEERKGGKVVYFSDTTGIPLRDPPPRPDVEPEAFDLLPPEDSDFLENRFDGEEWNEEQRGKPPVFDGPIPVEMVVIGTFSLSTRKEPNISHDVWDAYRLAERDLLKMTSDALDQWGRDTDTSTNLRLLDGYCKSKGLDRTTLVQLFNYEGTGIHNFEYESYDFFAGFYIEPDDLAAANFDAAFSHDEG